MDTSATTGTDPEVQAPEVALPGTETVIEIETSPEMSVAERERLMILMKSFSKLEERLRKLSTDFSTSLVAMSQLRLQISTSLQESPEASPTTSGDGATSGEQV